jgi:hypothetical protein
MANLQATSVNGTLTVNSGTISGSGTSLTSIPGTALNDGAVTSAKIAENTLAATKFGFSGAVLQTQVVRYDGRPGFTNPASAGTGTAITNMRLTITPIYANSMIVCEWRMHGESNDHNFGWRVTKNGARIDGTYAGYNTNSGNNNHSLILHEGYDTDDSSTPHCYTILYFDYPNTTSSVYYDPCCAASRNTASGTFFINRTAGSAGQANHENGVSFGRIMEIRQ